MARTKNKIAADQFTIQEYISDAVHDFARQILHLLGSSTLGELSALRETAPLGKGASARTVEHKVEQPVPRVNNRVLEDDEPEVLDAAAEDRILEEALAAEMPKVPKVACPVAGCTNPGIRPRRNFCLKHSRLLTKTEQGKLREQQKKRLRGEKQASSKKR